MNLTGTKGADYLIGTSEADNIKGGKGRDVLDGRDGADTLKGGRGADTFLLRADQLDIDIIKDFQSGKDRIVLDVADGWLPHYNEETGDIGSIYFGPASGDPPIFGPVVGNVLGSPSFGGVTDLISI